MRIVIEVASYFIGIPMLRKLVDDERAKLVILLNFLALVLSVLTPYVGFVFCSRGNVPPVFVAVAL